MTASIKTLNGLLTLLQDPTKLKAKLAELDSKIEIHRQSIVESRKASDQALKDRSEADQFTTKANLFGENLKKREQELVLAKLSHDQTVTAHEQAVKEFDDQVKKHAELIANSMKSLSDEKKSLDEVHQKRMAELSVKEKALGKRESSVNQREKLLAEKEADVNETLAQARELAKRIR